MDALNLTLNNKWLTVYRSWSLITSKEINLQTWEAQLVCSSIFTPQSLVILKSKTPCSPELSLDLLVFLFVSLSWPWGKAVSWSIACRNKSVIIQQQNKKFSNIESSYNKSIQAARKQGTVRVHNRSLKPAAITIVELGISGDFSAAPVNDIS